MKKMREEKEKRENTLNKSAAKLVRRKSHDLFCLAGLSFLAPACPEIIGKRKPWTAYHSRRTMWIIRVGGVESLRSTGTDSPYCAYSTPRFIMKAMNDVYWVESRGGEESREEIEQKGKPKGIVFVCWEVGGGGGGELRSIILSSIPHLFQHIKFDDIIKKYRSRADSLLLSLSIYRFTKICIYRIK